MDDGGRRGKGEEKKEKKIGMWWVVREIYWCERNNKNKLHMYLLIDDIKVVCTLSFTFEVNYETIVMSNNSSKISYFL